MTNRESNHANDFEERLLAARGTGEWGNILVDFLGSLTVQEFNAMSIEVAKLPDKNSEFKIKNKDSLKYEKCLMQSAMRMASEHYSKFQITDNSTVACEKDPVAAADVTTVRQFGNSQPTSHPKEGNSSFDASQGTGSHCRPAAFRSKDTNGEIAVGEIVPLFPTTHHDWWDHLLKFLCIEVKEGIHHFKEKLLKNPTPFVLVKGFEYRNKDVMDAVECAISRIEFEKNRPTQGNRDIPSQRQCMEESVKEPIECDVEFSEMQTKQLPLKGKKPNRSLSHGNKPNDKETPTRSTPPKAPRRKLNRDAPQLKSGLGKQSQKVVNGNSDLPTFQMKLRRKNSIQYDSPSTSSKHGRQQAKPKLIGKKRKTSKDQLEPELQHGVASTSASKRQRKSRRNMMGKRETFVQKDSPKPYKKITYDNVNGSSDDETEAETHGATQGASRLQRKAGKELKPLQKRKGKNHNLTCEKCGFESKYERNFIRHLKTHIHSTDGPSKEQYTCDIIIDGVTCEKRFSRKDNLLSHQLGHSGFKCTVQGCQYVGKSYNASQVHKRNHEKMKKETTKKG